MLVEGCHVCCSVRRAIHFVKRKIIVEESFGLAVRRLNPNTTDLPAACSIFLSAFREKVMKALKKIEQAAWAWQVVVQVRWQRIQCRVANRFNGFPNTRFSLTSSGGEGRGEEAVKNLCKDLRMVFVST